MLSAGYHISIELTVCYSAVSHGLSLSRYYASYIIRSVYIRVADAIFDGSVKFAGERADQRLILIIADHYIFFYRAVSYGDFVYTGSKAAYISGFQYLRPRFKVDVFYE